MRLRISVTLVALALATGPQVARADHPAACGAGYVGAAECVFVYRGSPMRLHGESNATNASVRVWVTLEGYPELGSLAACTDARATKATCDATVPEGGPAAVVPEQFGTFYLRCHVQGAGYGTYRCATETRP